MADPQIGGNVPASMSFFSEILLYALEKKEHDPEWLIRACMRFELLELALELVLALIHSVGFSPRCWPIMHLTHMISAGRPSRALHRTHPKQPRRHGYHIHSSTSF
jgi:hypothetical protein